ncbi:MAG TPA: 4Fe-4S dicluster domain-containing protein [Planctomycetes bacterium]|nr:4Fe-4S dicluster domain-containing protein [Planctomycetota bacterium]
MEPLVDVVIPGAARITYSRVTEKDVPGIIRAAVDGEVYEKLATGRVEAEPYVIDGREEKYSTDTSATVFSKVPAYSELPFMAQQMHVAMRNCGFIDPASIEEYVAKGGYAAALKALTEMTPEGIIAEIKASGLRGRGGGGFPTGRKWETARKAHSEPKYVICNADEGDPGAYMDRAIIEGDPHSVIEGMIIGSYAIGSNTGYVYVREEYPLAVQRIRAAIKQAEEHGFLGADIFGTGHDFTIRINRGAGAFVCGESTALMASLEGRVGEPRAKYIHTVESGLWGKPSCLNNVETWNNIPVIIARGAGWFSSIGTEGSKGTKVFSLVGKINRVGLVEVPMGITLREVVEGIGGGIPGGGRFKAVQTGGPSGGCIPARFLDTPVDFDRLTELGSMMGSGGMIVMDDHTCMVDVARYFLAFLKDESCGKCVPCREGTSKMLEIVERICAGEGMSEDIDLLKEVASMMADAALCALGTSAPNPVLTTLKYFEDEYRAHIEEKKCPAGVCRALIKYSIDPEKCTGCTLCAKSCPVKAIAGERKKPHKIKQEVCTRCGICMDTCKFDAVKVL